MTLKDTTIPCEVPEINPEKDADRMDKLLKQRALVRLANTSVLKKDVEAFRTKYPTWENDLVKILKVLGKKQQKKDELAKKKKRSEVKSKKKAEKLPKSDPNDDDKSEPKNEEPKGNEVNLKIIKNNVLPYSCTHLCLCIGRKERLSV